MNDRELNVYSTFLTLGIFLFTGIIAIIGIGINKDKYHHLHAINDDICYIIKNYDSNEYYYIVELENGAKINLLRSEYLHYYGKECPICNE